MVAYPSSSSKRYQTHSQPTALFPELELPFEWNYCAVTSIEPHFVEKRQGRALESIPPDSK